MFLTVKAHSQLYMCIVPHMMQRLNSHPPHTRQMHRGLCVGSIFTEPEACLSVWDRQTLKEDLTWVVKIFQLSHLLSFSFKKDVHFSIIYALLHLEFCATAVAIFVRGFKTNTSLQNIHLYHVHPQSVLHLFRTFWSITCSFDTTNPVTLQVVFTSFCLPFCRCQVFFFFSLSGFLLPTLCCEQTVMWWNNNSAWGSLSAPAHTALCISMT